VVDSWRGARPGVESRKGYGSQGLPSTQLAGGTSGRQLWRATWPAWRPWDPAPGQRAASWCVPSWR